MTWIIRDKHSGAIIAQGIEGETVREFENHWYFNPEAVNMAYLRVTERTYHCPYKGICYWIDLVTPTVIARNIAWVYREPRPGYEFIKDLIAFYARETSATRAEAPAQAS